MWKAPSVFSSVISSAQKSTGACDSVMANNDPDDSAVAECIALGKALV